MRERDIGDKSKGGGEAGEQKGPKCEIESWKEFMTMWFWRLMDSVISRPHTRQLGLEGSAMYIKRHFFVSPLKGL